MIIKTPKGGMSKADWLRFRNNGIGGSEAAIILGLNPYQSAVELFYKKVEQTPETEETERMYWGTILEGTIAKTWQCYNPTTNDISEMISNSNNDKIIRKCQNVNFILQNDKFPHLFANIDRLIIDKEKGNGILEIKTSSDFAVKVWESGIPPYNLIQLQCYLGIMDLQYGELAILQNGRSFAVYPIQRNNEIIDGVIETTKAFWERVLEARILLSEGKGFEKLEPEPDDTKVYEKFMKERFIAKPIEIEGDPELLKTARKEKELTEQIKPLEQEKQGCKNILVSAMREAEKINFGTAGYCSMKANVKGVRTYRNNVT